VIIRGPKRGARGLKSSIRKKYGQGGNQKMTPGSHGSGGGYKNSFKRKRGDDAIADYTNGN